MKKINIGLVLVSLLLASTLSAAELGKRGKKEYMGACKPDDLGVIYTMTNASDTASCDPQQAVGDESVHCTCVSDGVGGYEWVLLSTKVGGGAGVTDGDKGDVAVTGDGATWTVEDLTCTNCIGGTEIDESTLSGVGTIGGTLTATDNLITRTDGTGGATIQASPLSLSDVSGVTTTIATITPAATTGASVAGQSLAITASPAVASTDTAGAAAGGSITITAGAAARLTSGNANGGNITLTTGAGIGTGTAGQVVVPSGTDSKPSLVMPNSSIAGWYWDPNSPDGWAYMEGTPTIKFDQGYITVVGNGMLTWGNQVNSFASSTSDIALRRDASGVLKVDSSSGSLRWLYQAGNRALSADFTSTSATPANLTGLTETLLTGRKYTFRMALRFSDSTAADGIRLDFDGGTATATDFGAACRFFTGTNAEWTFSDSTALATDHTVTTTTGAGLAECSGSFTVNAAGTFIPRAGQEAASGGTLTVETGSYLHVTDTSFN